ncbi:hypothetical protein ACSDR0_36335 [Streptosporangium sp. G11]|uniref:hypothetical protein n=1 Tax=Streptosporangium sp. G11 TaxID=3436926 RepID=UPI003EC11760
MNRYSAAGDPEAVEFGPARVRLVTFTEGLRRGPYAEEPRTLARLDARMRDTGLVTFTDGPHREIYLPDVRETDPERTRTMLRRPVRAV